MCTGCQGTPGRGYEVRGLIGGIERFLDAPEPEGVALVGIGNLGRAILAFFQGRRPKLRVVAAFDREADLVNRVIHGVRCYPMEELDAVVVREGIRVGIIAVPAGEAQPVADRLVAAGIRGLVNFAPTPLHAPPGVYVDDIDMTMSLEKVAFFARAGSPAAAVAAVKGSET
jgi:redox-sensing transcriptional repressor